MTRTLVLPFGEQLEGQTIRIELPETEVSLQRKRVPNAQSGAKERWILIGLGSEFRAQAGAAINRDGRAVTEQWRLEGEDFTLVIVESANDLTGSFVGKHDFLRQYAAQLNIPTMPRNSEEDVVSTHTPLSAYEVILRYSDTKKKR